MGGWTLETKCHVFGSQTAQGRSQSTPLHKHVVCWSLVTDQNWGFKLHKIFCQLRTWGVQIVQGNHDHCPVMKSWQRELNPFKKGKQSNSQKILKKIEFFNDIFKQSLVLVILGMLNPIMLIFVAYYKLLLHRNLSIIFIQIQDGFCRFSI